MSQATTLALEPELAAINREFRFYPSTVTEPKSLTKEQLKHFNEQGFLKGLPALTKEEIDEHRAFIDRLLAKTHTEGRDSYSINGYHGSHRAIYNLVKHPVIVGYVRDILGENFGCWGTHYFCKNPGDPKAVTWHQDGSYWPLSPTKTVTAWLAIDDTDRENGAMRFIPRSHLHGHIAYKFSEQAESNVLWQTVPNAESFGEPEFIELKAGQISLHSDLLLHGSLPNLSNRRRCGLTIRYIAVESRRMREWNTPAIICSGSDPDGHWVDCAVPTQE